MARWDRCAFDSDVLPRDSALVEEQAQTTGIVLDDDWSVRRALKNASGDLGFEVLVFYRAERLFARAIRAGLDQGLIYAVATAI